MKRTVALVSTLTLFAAAVAMQAQTSAGMLHEADAAPAGRNDSAMPTSRTDESTREELLRSAPTTLTGLIRSSTAESSTRGCDNNGIDLRRAKAVDNSIHLIEMTSPPVTEPSSRTDVRTREDLLRSMPTTLVCGMAKVARVNTIGGMCGMSGIGNGRVTTTDIPIEELEIATPMVSAPPTLARTRIPTVTMMTEPVDQPSEKASDTDRMDSTGPLLLQ